MRRRTCLAAVLVLVGSLTGALALVLAAALPFPARAVIIDSGDGSGNVEAPPDFPWWDHVDQRLGGTTIIHLGDGWVLTAKHVGMGVLLFGDERYAPDPETLVAFGEPDSPADLIVFRLAEGKPWPDLPPMELAETTPAPGEEVLMIGNGRDRGARFEPAWQGEAAVTGWRWGDASTKRWGTNRVASPSRVVDHGDTSTLAFATRFDSFYSGDSTPHEAQAALGDSGGAVFARRDPGDPDSDWVLAGVIFTVNHPNGGPLETALYGDFTHAVDLAAHRDELIAVVRPACANGRDDDGDGRTDHPEDPDCASPSDDTEATPPAPHPETEPFWLQGVLIVAFAAGVIVVAARRRSR